MAQLNDLLVAGASRMLNGLGVLGTINSDSILPNVTDTYVLGESGKRWNSAYIKTITGSHIILDTLTVNNYATIGGGQAATATNTGALRIKGGISTTQASYFGAGITTNSVITSSLSSSTHLAGNQGTAIINSTAVGTGYNMLAKMNSSNGVWTLGGWTTGFYLFYTANSTITAGTNTYTKQLKLMDESGNSTFPGTVTAPTFSGALSGNAATATKWQTPRTLTIGNTGKSVDGTASVSWSISEIGAAPASHNHTSLTGVTKIAFAADSSDSGSISTTVDGTNTYFDFNLADDPGQNDMWRWRFSPSGGTVFNAMTLDATTLTDAKLTVTGTISASSFTGAVIGNASTATTLQTARTLTIGNTGKSFNGSANVSWTLAEMGAVAKAGDTMTGNLTAPTYIATQKMVVGSTGLVDLTAAGTTRLYADGIAISNPATKNDDAWIRMTGTGESDSILEIATGDDANGTGVEQIVVRQYGSSGLAHEIKLLDGTGNTYLKRLIMNGALDLANGTWNKLGDDVQFGDNNVAGAFCIQGLNGTTMLRMTQHGGSSAGTISWNGSQFSLSHTLSGTVTNSLSAASISDFTNVSFTTSGAGWYKLASFAGTGIPRGQVRFTIRGTGGSSMPNTVDVIIDCGWSTSGVNYITIDGYRNQVGGIRMTNDGTNSFIELYAPSAINSTTLLIVPTNTYSSWVNTSWSWTTGGALAASTGSTVTASCTHTYSGHTRTNVIAANKVYGAVWNDYAEYRQTKETITPGRVVIETGRGDLILSTQRMQPGGNVVSDTFGFAIGETEECKTPIAVSGRVLVYPYEDRYSYEPGDAVCTGPNGTVSKMTREEIWKYPERIVGTVSEIPEYLNWGQDNVEVNGRIWIKVR